jgi:hypothetical protein
MKTKNFTPVVFLSLLLLLPLRISWAEVDSGGEYIDSINLKAPENSLVTSVETDGYSGIIYYTTKDGADGALTLDPPPVWGTLPSGYTVPFIAPIAVIVDENTTGLQEWQGGYYVVGGAASLDVLEGKLVKELKVTRREVYTWHPQLGSIHLSSQWIVQAKLSSQTSNGGGNKPTPSNQTKEFEGFIENISSTELTISKEGKVVNLTVTDQTGITLNGQSATVDDLLLGDKAKVMYDPNTNEALRLIVER